MGYEPTLSVSPIVIPNVIYVRTNGDDNTGDGSFAKPYRTAQKGFDIQAGDSTKVIEFGAGFWPEDISLTTATPGTPKVYLYRGQGREVTILQSISLITSAVLATIYFWDVYDKSVSVNTLCFANSVAQDGDGNTGVVTIIGAFSSSQIIGDTDAFSTDYSATPFADTAASLSGCGGNSLGGATSALAVLDSAFSNYFAPAGSVDITTDGGPVATNKFTGRGTASNGAPTSNKLMSPFFF